MLEGVRSNNIDPASVIDEVLGNVTQDGIVKTGRIATAALGVQIAQGAGAIVAKAVKATYTHLNAIIGTLAEGDWALVMLDEEDHPRGQYAKINGVLEWMDELTETQAAAAAALAKQYRDEALAVAPSFWEQIRDDAIEGSAAEVVRAGLEANRSFAEADRSTERANRALIDADRAALAAAASVVNSQTFPTIAAGLLGVLDNQTFDVQGSGSTSTIRYRKLTSSTYTELLRFPSAKAVENVHSMQVLRFQQPNLVPDRVNRQTEATVAGSAQVGFGPASVLPYVSSYNGRPCWQFDNNGLQTTSNVEIVAPASQFGSEIVASVLIHAQTAAGAGATSANNRVLLRQFTGASIGTRTEIAAARQPASGGNLATPSTAASGEQRVEFSGVAKDPTATFISISIESANTGGATARSVWFSEVLLGSGRDPAFRLRPPVSMQYPNLLPNNSWAVNSSLSGGMVSVAVESGYNVMSILKADNPAGNAFRSYVLPAVGALAPGKSLQLIHEMLTDTTTVNSVRGDILFLDANGAEITAERVIGSGNPAVAASTWTKYSASKAVIPNCSTIQFRFTWFNVSTAPGTYAKFRRPAVITSTDNEIVLDDTFLVTAGATLTSATMVCMDPVNGNDAGDGSVGQPVKNFDRALDIGGGVGTIVLPNGVLDVAPTNQLDLSRVKNLTIVGGLGAQPGLARTVLRYGLKLTGITKTPGQTRIYQATAALGADVPNFLWLEGTPDSRTAVTPARAHHATKGRSHRLMQTRIERTGDGINQSANKTAALAEIEASLDPRFWFSVSEGIVYFAIPGGGDATASNIYASTSHSFTKNRPSVFGTYAGGGRLTLIDVDARYVNFTFPGISRLEAYGCYVHGAPNNCWDITGKALLVGCEASGAGSGVTGNGDGFNCHDEGDWEHRFCWSHDNRDDGWSSHENSREVGISPVAENNWGSGLTPAYGCNALYINPLTVENALQSVRLRTGKLGGVECHHNPNTPYDNGQFTSVEVYGGVSIGDRNGYIDGKTNSGGTTEAYMKVFNVLTINPVQYGIAAQTFGNCRHQGTGTAKHPSAGSLGIYNGTLVS